MFRLFGLAVCDVAAATLAWSGLMKLFEPGAFASAATLARLVRRRSVATLVARLVGLLEVALAVTVLTVGAPWTAALLAAAFAVFAAVSARAVMVQAPSCGCFGQRSVRPTWTHVALDAGVAVVAAASITSGSSLPDRLDPSLPLAGTYVVFVVMGAALLVGALTRAERPIPVVVARRSGRPVVRP